MAFVDLQVFEVEHAPIERRYRMLELELDVFIPAVFVPTPPGKWFRCYDGLPEGSRVVSVGWDALKRTLGIIVEHDSFDVLPADGYIPRIGASYMSKWEAPKE